MGCCPTAECQMTADASSAGIGRFHNNAATGRGCSLTREQRHETTRMNITETSIHEHMTTTFGCSRSCGGAGTECQHTTSDCITGADCDGD